MKREEGQLYGQVLLIPGLSQGQSSCTQGLGVVPGVVGIARAAQPGRPSGMPLPGR